MPRSWIIALLIALAAAGWMVSGRITGSGAAKGPAATVAEPVDPPPPQVRVRRVTAEPMISRLTLQGRTLADRTVDVGAATTGTVEEVLVERGARVEAGEVLVRLSVEDRQAKLAQTRALLTQRELEFEAANRLNEQGYRADTSLAEARAGLNAARAQVELAEIELARTTITAPFAGIVDARPVEIGDYVDAGDTVARLVDLDPIRVQGQVSERYLGRIGLGMTGSVRLLDGTEIAGAVSYLGAVADMSTRTFPVEMRIPNPNGRVIENVTAAMSLPIDQAMAHQLPPSALTLADDGTLGVKAVAGDGTVVFHPATVLADSRDGVWVAGLPESFTLIAVGQEFVVPGQKVDPVPADRLARDGAS